MESIERKDDDDGDVHVEIMSPTAEEEGEGPFCICSIGSVQLFLHLC